jgi:hypothetical protein
MESRSKRDTFKENKPIELGTSDKETLGKIMCSERFRVRCKLCKDVIESVSSKDFKKCKCDAIGIDGGRNISGRRLIGEISNMESVE